MSRNTASGCELVDRGGGGKAVRGLAGDLDVGVLAQPAAQLVARRRFVVDDEHADHARAAA